jgi:hypothetical protein
MNGVSQVLREVVGLFVDDGALAIAILAVVAAAAAVAVLAPGTIAAGLTLVIGCVAVLIVNVLRAARR